MKYLKLYENIDFDDWESEEESEKRTPVIEELSILDNLYPVVDIKFGVGQGKTFYQKDNPYKISRIGKKVSIESKTDSVLGSPFTYSFTYDDVIRFFYIK